jgi:tRNA(Ile)-lysidine synthase
MNLQERVRAFIEERELLHPRLGLVVGVSGGPDSLCLLDVLHHLAADWSLILHVAHLNHGLRPEAADEAEFVRAQAEARELSFHAETADVRAHAHEHKQSLEEAARELRYAFLVRVAMAVEAEAIAVAHTADDQAETVLMHLLRGSGLAGLRGMLPKTEVGGQKLEVGVSDLRPAKRTSDLQIIRPLLTTTRAEVEAYCAERGLHPVYDATNQDTAYFRNRLRHELLPEMETYNPNIRGVLARMAEVAAGEHEVLQEVIQALWKRVVRTEGVLVEFDREHWLALTVPEQRALLREAVHRLRPDERDVDFIPLERAVRFSRKAVPGRSCDVRGGLRLKITSEAVTLSSWNYHPDADLPLFDAVGQLPQRWQLAVESLDPGSWSLAQVESKADRWCAYVDAGKFPSSSLRLRSRWPGDRLQPLGMGGHSMKVSDVFVNAKVEESLRGRWPLVLCFDQVVWVAGLRLDERYKVTEETQTVLRLSFVREETKVWQL